MKQTIIDRYEIAEDKKVVIDVSIKSVEHLYHNFDKTAPYYRKELDESFVDYLTECVQEIGKYPFVVRISLGKMPNATLMDRVRRSVNSYYIYLKEIEIRAMKRMLRRFVFLFVVGLVLLVLAILANRRLALHGGVVAEVFEQGLTIAAWVSLWEALVNIFLEWRPHRENIRLYNKIINTQIIFRHLVQ